MDCETYQADLPDLLYGELDAEARACGLSHRQACADCDGLTRELEAVKGGLPPLRPPPLAVARLKLAARDELLARGPDLSPAGRSSDGAPREAATLRLVSAVVLAACVGAVGFALGVTWQRPAPERALLPVPRTPTDVPPPPAWAEPAEPPRAPPRLPPRSPEAWQRVLFDTAAGVRAQGELKQASEFFERARAVAPEGPLAAAAMVGQAEALLGQGDEAQALRLLEEARVGVYGGRLVGGPGLLQRIAELTQEAENR